jgi:hypothetical protein
MKAASFILILLFLVWLPIEDTHIWASAALAIGAGALLAFHFAPRFRSTSWFGALFMGAMLGGSLPLLTIFLMAFKSGLHAHGFADFTLRQLSAVLYSIPVTILIGLLIAALTKLTISRGVQEKSKI